MYELVRLCEKSYYIDCPSRIGIYMVGEKDVCLIDTGNSPDTGKKVLGVCEAQGWNVKYIINTHAHADHTGGNGLIQRRTGCRIFSVGRDLCFVNEPTLNNSYCFGGLPPKELCSKFLLAEKSNAQELTEENIPEGMRFRYFKGHSFDHIAIICDDGTTFIGDILCGRSTIEKYHIFFLRDPGEYVESCERIKEIPGNVFCASHFEPIESREELVSLADLNIGKVNEIKKVILDTCRDGKCFDDVLKGVCDSYGLELSFTQYAIAGSTVRSFLSGLLDGGLLEVQFCDNYLLWKTV